MDNRERAQRTAGKIAALWGIAGFSLLMIQAIHKLAAVSIDAFAHAFSPVHWLALAANVVFMAWSEGFKGFQRGFSPRFAMRTKHLLDGASHLERLLAPLYCMHFFNAPARRMLVSYLLLLAILVFIFIFQRIPQPWRGILDAGVVVGLAWGLLSTWYYCWMKLSSGKPVTQASAASPGNTTT